MKRVKQQRESGTAFELLRHLTCRFYTASAASFARRRQDGFDGFRGARKSGTAGGLRREPDVFAGYPRPERCPSSWQQFHAGGRRTPDDAATKKGANPNFGTSDER